MYCAFSNYMFAFSIYDGYASCTTDMCTVYVKWENGLIDLLWSSLVCRRNRKIVFLTYAAPKRAEYTCPYSVHIYKVNCMH